MNLTGRANYSNELDQNNDLLIYQPGHTSGHKRQAGFLRPDKALARFSPRMPRLATTTTTTAALAVALLALNLIALGPALASCEWSWCVGHTVAPSSKPSAASTAPQRSFITDARRTRVGDLYAPAPGRRVQIRDNRRNIIGYIEADGTVTDTRRNRVGTVGKLYD